MAETTLSHHMRLVPVVNVNIATRSGGGRSIRSELLVHGEKAPIIWILVIVDAVFCARVGIGAPAHS